jgi:hypothetical protein
MPIFSTFGDSMQGCHECNIFVSRTPHGSRLIKRKKIGLRGTPAEELTELPACFAVLHGEKYLFRHNFFFSEFLTQYRENRKIG